MCSFKSGIVTRDNKVYWLPESDHHSDIIEAFPVLASMERGGKDGFVGVEATPIGSALIEELRALDAIPCRLIVDEYSLPDWWGEAHASNALCVMSQALVQAIWGVAGVTASATSSIEETQKKMKEYAPRPLRPTGMPRMTESLGMEAN